MNAMTGQHQQSPWCLRRLRGLEQAPGVAPANARFWLFLAGCYVLWTVWMVLPPLIDFQSAFVRRCYSLAVGFAVEAGPAWIYFRCIDKVAPLEALRLRAAPKNAWPGLAFGLLVLAVMCVELVLLEHGRWRGLAIMDAREWAAFGARLAIVMISEEIAFRGFVHRKLRAAYPWWCALLLSSALFMFLHWPGWIHNLGLSADLIGLSIGTFVCGVMFALMFEITGSLWPAITLHFLCNVCVRLLGP